MAALKETDGSALCSLAAELAAIPQNAVTKVNIDVESAVAIVHQSMPRIRRLRSRIAEELPKLDTSLIDKLPRYAAALLEAQEQTSADFVGGAARASVLTPARDLRERLASTALLLVRCGLVDKDALRELRMGNGYENAAHDLELLAQVLCARWPSLEGKHPLTLADLDHAVALAAALRRPSVDFSERETAFDQRARAFTLLLNAYTRLRKAVIYLCDTEAEANEIAPHLYPGRRRADAGQPKFSRRKTPGQAKDNMSNKPFADVVPTQEGARPRR